MSVIPPKTKSHSRQSESLFVQTIDDLLQKHHQDLSLISFVLERIKNNSIHSRVLCRCARVARLIVAVTMKGATVR
jgi:hypothetical protein